MGSIDSVARIEEIVCILSPEMLADPAYRLMVEMSIGLRADARPRLGDVRRALRGVAIRLGYRTPRWWTEVPLKSTHVDVLLSYIVRHEVREASAPHARLHELVIVAIEALRAPEVGQ
jgi:hypothetical protein